MKTHFNYIPNYGNLHELNKCRKILDSVTKGVLENIVNRYLILLDTSSAVYELNGDYALGIFSSDWCKVLDDASRKLCKTEDNYEALQCGKWLCHESCWTHASKISIEQKRPVDIECNGGIRIYAVPIYVNDEVIGSINIGYGNPPLDVDKISRIAKKYNLDPKILINIAKNYKGKSDEIIELTKKQLVFSADFIGLLVEKKIQEEENRIFNSIIDSSLNALCINNLNNDFIYVNLEFEKMWGYSFKDLRQKKLFEIIPTDVGNKFENNILPTVLENDFWSGEEWLCRKNGIDFFASLSSSLIKNRSGEPVAFLTSFLDITEQKKVKQALEEREVTLKNIYDSKLMGFMLWDADGEIIDSNDTFLSMLGYNREEFFSKRVFWLDIIPAEYTELYNSVVSSLAARKEVPPFEEEFICKEGNRISVLIGTTVLPDPKLGGAAFVIDITQRRLLEEQLRQAEKMEAVGHLSGGIAHDFNNILTIILINTETALKTASKDSQEFANLEQIRFACLRAKEIVKQLLFFARKTKQEKRPLNIKNIIKDTLKLLRATIPVTIKITSDIQDDLWNIIADPAQINQLLINLCTNAVQAVENEGGEIAVEVSNVIIGQKDVKQYGKLEKGNYIKMVISDTGSGIDSDITKNIFEPYFTTRSVDKGIGLGLSVVHGIVKDLNGFISVESDFGTGTSFEILFPTTKKIVENNTVDTQHKNTTGNATILIIDDEEALVSSLNIMLSIMGYSVIGFTDPEKAFEEFKSDPDKFDLVITDMTMPGITGDVLSQKILQERSDIPIILCTGYNDKIEENSAYSKGIKKYLEKPFNQLELTKVINDLLKTES